MLLGWGVFEIVRGLEAEGYRWRWEAIPQFFVREDAETGAMRPGLLLTGLLVTLQISVASIVLSLALGIVVGVCRIVREPVLRASSRIYIELIRNTPLLVQIYVIYYVIGSALDLSRFAAGVAALTVFTAAYIAEVVRGGIESIERGQTEAAQALGLSWMQSMRHVIMPQALRRMLAPLTGQFITLIKDSSLVSVIAIMDLTLAGKTIQGTYFLSLETWLTVAALYFCMTFPLALVSRYFEKRFEYHH